LKKHYRRIRRVAPFCTQQPIVIDQSQKKSGQDKIGF
jgi:hypothetical protein